jgi:serine/threonine protein kinase
MDTLGKGGLATVKVGLEFTSGTRVAVKIINKEKLVNPREQISMAREITIMKLLKHKNILRLYDIYENEEKIFLILDLYEGGDLYGYLTQKGALPAEEALLLFKQIILGVEYCHKCMIVHRDLKPENLLLSADKKHLVISDFGLSTGMQGSRSVLKTRCGTVHYISPEVAKGDPYVGMASDIWSVGIILYAMVTATLPFDGPNSVAVLKKIVRGEFNIPPNVPRELQDLIRLMLTGDPKERITIPQIKQHPWFLGVEETPRHDDGSLEKPYVLSVPEIDTHADVIANLRLLGWEQSELMNELLDQEKMNMAKVFFKLLVEQKSLPADSDTPQNVDKKVLRRRSIGGGGSSAARIGVTTDTTKPSAISKNKHKRASQRGSARIALPVTRTNSNHKNQKEQKEQKDQKDHHSSLAESAQTRSTTSNHPQTTEKSKERTSPTQLSPKSDKSKAVIWTPSALEPELKHSLESTKSVTQILEALKHCFADLGQYDISAKQTKNGGLKVKARKSGKRHGPPVVTVNYLFKSGEGEEGGKLVIKGKKSREELKEFTKKIEENVV